MMKNIHKTVAIFAVIAALTSGCRSTEEYKRLAEAGNKYAFAVDQLLTTAGDIHIDANSETILAYERTSKPDKYDPKQLSLEYEHFSQKDKERVKIIEDLRMHNRLLRDYFFKLQELANSDAPDRVKREIGGIVENLNTLGDNLKKSNLITNKGVFQGVASLVIDARIHGAIREELEKNNNTIVRELLIQQDMLNTLGDYMKHDISIIQKRQEERLVFRPLVQPQLIQNEEEWIDNRRKIITMNGKVVELISASEALGEFKEIFQDAVEGKMSIVRLNNVLNDIDSFLALVTTNK